MKAWVPVFLALLAACTRHDPIAAEELALRVALPAGLERVPFGQSFPLEVMRVWEKDLVPGEWDDRALAPLVVRLEEVTLREDEYDAMFIVFVPQISKTRVVRLRY